jgi:predicted DNA-binding transcriptional regulator AlpA
MTAAHGSDGLGRRKKAAFAGGCLHNPESKRHPAMSPDTTILTVNQVCQRLTMSEPTLRRYAKTVSDFPRKIPLGPRRVGYLASDIERYVASRYEAAGSATNS